MTPVVMPPNTRWASTKAKAPLLPGVGGDVPVPGIKISAFLGAMERDGGRPWAGV